MSSEQQRLHEEHLQEEIKELRGEVAETVEALVHKADVPARGKERGREVKEEAIERGIELHQQTVARGSELSARALEWANAVKAQVVERGSELRNQAFDAAERARESVSQTPTERWISWAGLGLALFAAIVMVRRVRAS
jgi:hypothetical protein